MAVTRKPKGNKLIRDCVRRSYARMWRQIGVYKNRPALAHNLVSAGEIGRVESFRWYP